MAEFVLQEEAVPDRGQGFYYDYHKGRYIHLHVGNTDSFFQALGNREFEINMDYEPRKMLRLSEQECPLELTICGAEDAEIMLICARIIVCIGCRLKFFRSCSRFWSIWINTNMMNFLWGKRNCLHFAENCCLCWNVIIK